ncbi:hypothetical protein M422DRAFT_242365 [Sphaerobolus stellatus SS14]|nr:hypothetical protein M422DRAFT_242365 [Sphaerobolus stellatus SS14]
MDEIVLGEAAELEALIDDHQDSSLPRAELEKITMLSYAAVTTSIGETMNIIDLPNEDPQALADDAARICCSLQEVEAVEPEQILKSDQVQGVTTSIPRQIQWKGMVAVSATGNAANAATVAGINANNNLQRRRKTWIDVKVPYLAELTTAMISTFQPLVANDFAIVLWNESLMLARGVLHFYEKGGGKNVTHAWSGESSSIGQISYISVQLYEHLYGATFSETPLELARLYAKGFTHLPSHCFLYRIPRNSKPQQSGNVLFLPNNVEVQFWQTLLQNLGSVKKGVQILTSQPKKG